MGAKVHVREEKNPDHLLRSRNDSSVDLNEVTMHRQLGCWLGSSHSFKECVTAHRSSGRAWIIIGHKPGAEDVEPRSDARLVGEHSSPAEGAPRGALEGLEKQM